MKKFDCNKCTTKCKVSSEFPKMRIKPPRNMPLFGCNMFKPATAFKMPLLLHCATDQRKVEKLAKVLHANNLGIRETNRYPFFVLTVA